MARTRFRVRRDGSIIAPPEVWGYLERKASQMVLRDRANGHAADLLLEFVDAAAEAKQVVAAPDTVVPSTEPATPPIARLEVTPKDAAERMGCSERYIRRLCSEGRIRARQVGRNWLIDPDDIDRHSPRRTPQ